jgi:hypothetical protein
VDQEIGHGALDFSCGSLQSTKLQCSRRRLRWTNETNAADQNELIILLPPEHSATTNTVVIINVEHITDSLTNRINLMG